MQNLQEERSLGELFGDLSRELTTLVRQEIALAQAELKRNVASLGRSVALMAVGGVLLFAALLALMATIIIALAYALPWWLAALIVTVAVACIGGALALMGYDAFKRTQLAPQQTMQTIKEDAAWMKEQTT